MNRFRMIILFAAMLFASGRVGALTEQELQAIRFAQYPGKAVPMDLEFKDADGTAMKLKECFQGTPVLLVPGYFRCRMLCEGVSDGVILALQGSRRELGKDFRVVFVSIDPKEPLVEAKAKKAMFLKRYARPGVDSGCNFLTGEEEAIKTLTDAIGYSFRYDPQSGEYAHPAGFVVVRSDGRIFRYFLGVSFSAAELDNAIAEAAKGSAPPSPIEQFVLLCFHYNPVRSRYGDVVMTSVRVLALATIVGIVVVVVRSRRARADRDQRPPAPKDK